MPPSLTDRILAAQPDPRARAVLVAAYETFLQYGVRRASMQDIADRAGMSRAALYLHYKNKNDIFRALMVAYFAAAAEAVAEALATHADPVEALRAAFVAAAGDTAETMITSPHAEELLSTKQSAARDAVADGNAALAAIYADWLRSGAEDGRFAPAAVGADPDATARAMLAALDGLKQSSPGWDAYAAGRDRLAVLFGRALRP